MYQSNYTSLLSCKWSIIPPDQIPFCTEGEGERRNSVGSEQGRRRKGISLNVERSELGVVQVELNGPATVGDHSLVGEEERERGRERRRLTFARNSF